MAPYMRHYEEGRPFNTSIIDRDANLTRADRQEDEAVCDIDPLNLDTFFEYSLPEFNYRKNTSDIARVTLRHIPQDHQIRAYTRFEALAALRDLGFLASSLATGDADPRTVPGLERALLTLSSKTREVPRDTVFSYGPRNPNNERMRTFTSAPEEKFFINSFREGMKDLPDTIASLDRAHDYSIYDSDFINFMVDANQSFSGMVNSIVEVKRKISPEVFTYQLRPFFPTYVIGEKTYVGPGGAQMPVITVDHALWGADQKDNAAYSHYFFENLQYMPIHEQMQAMKLYDRTSLVQSVLEEASRANEYDDQDRLVATRACNSVDQLLLTIQKFRFPHKKLADDNMAVRPAGALGSGGYNTDILSLLIEQTANARNKVKRAKILLGGEGV